MPAYPPELQRELLRMTVLGSAALLVMSMALAALEGSAFGLRWLLTGLGCWGIVIWQCRRRLHLNHPAAGIPVYRTLGQGNLVTLLRGLLIAATAGFLMTTPVSDNRHALLFLPALFYSLAALGDLLDGRLARRQQQTTQLGTQLDTALDALGLLVAPLLAVLYAKLHVSYLLVSIAYYLFQWGLYWRRRHNRAVYPLPPSRLRRYLAGCQMGFVAVALWPPVPDDITRPLGIVFMLPLLTGFWIDWLHVSGRRLTGRELPP